MTCRFLDVIEGAPVFEPFGAFCHTRAAAVTVIQQAASHPDNTL